MVKNTLTIINPENNKNVLDLAFQLRSALSMSIVFLPHDTTATYSFNTATLKSGNLPFGAGVVFTNFGGGVTEIGLLPPSDPSGEAHVTWTLGYNAPSLNLPVRVRRLAP